MTESRGNAKLAASEAYSTAMQVIRVAISEGRTPPCTGTLYEQMRFVAMYIQQLEEIVFPIQRLRREEGDSVEILCAPVSSPSAGIGAHVSERLQNSNRSQSATGSQLVAEPPESMKDVATNQISTEPEQAAEASGLQPVVDALLSSYATGSPVAGVPELQHAGLCGSSHLPAAADTPEAETATLRDGLGPFVGRFLLRDVGGAHRDWPAQVIGENVARDDSIAGIGIQLANHGTLGMVSPSAIIYLEMNLVPVLYVWADINQEEPTHRIDLSGAAETKRREP